jgi:HEPN domain-containing protein
MLRIREAQTLLGAGEYSGAYYLAGYSVECALKACIARKFMRHDFPDRRTVLDSHTHDLVKLAKIGEVEQELEGDTNQKVKKNWDVARGWSEESRYRLIERAAAQAMIDAIIQRGHGVLPCIRHHW